jgi:hypothetical protein
MVSPGLAVLIHTYSRTAGTFSTAATTTDGDGSFRFGEVLLLDEGGYAVTTDYGGMRYSALLAPQDLSQPLELRVYEPTQDISVVQVVHQALVLSEVIEADQEIRAAEFLTLTNTSDRTLVPDLSNVGQGRFSFLRFSLPPQALGLDVQSDLIGGEIIPTGAGFALTAPVPPGNHSISFSYGFPYQEHGAVYRPSLLQGAEVYQVLVSDRLGQIEVASPQLESMPPIQVGGVAYRVWEGRGFAPGQGLELSLNRLPQPSLPIRLGRSVGRATFWAVAIPIMFGVAVAGLLFYGGVKAPRGGSASTALSGPTVTMAGNPNGSAGRRADLVRSIAALDESFRQGKLEPAEYRIHREQLKARVLATPDPLDSSRGQDTE